MELSPIILDNIKLITGNHEIINIKFIQKGKSGDKIFHLSNKDGVQIKARISLDIKGNPDVSSAKKLESLHNAFSYILPKFYGRIENINITEWVEGDTLAEVELKKNQLIQIGKIYGYVSQKEVINTNYDLFLEKHLSYLFTYIPLEFGDYKKRITSFYKKYLKKEMIQYKYDLTGCHRWNFILNKNKVYFIDIEDIREFHIMGSGIPTFIDKIHDISSMIYFLQSYNEVVPIPKNTLKLVWCIYILKNNENRENYLELLKYIIDEDTKNIKKHIPKLFICEKILSHV